MVSGPRNGIGLSVTLPPCNITPIWIFPVLHQIRITLSGVSCMSLLRSARVGGSPGRDWLGDPRSSPRNRVNPILGVSDKMNRSHRGHVMCDI